MLVPANALVDENEPCGVGGLGDHHTPECPSELVPLRLRLAPTDLFFGCSLWLRPYAGSSGRW
jgi:hypothetical protein